MPHYYPVLLNVRGKRCVVVGGGKVALRKVKVLLEHGANVEVVSPALCPELSQLADTKTISVHCKEYEPEDLNGAFIAIAATAESDTNQKVADEARRQKILVNVASSLEQSDFVAPSYLRRDALTIAVSTSGQSPALARKIRTRLEKEITDQYGALTRLIVEVRAEIKRERIKIADDHWQEALDLDLLLEMLKKGEREKAKALLLSRLKEGQGNG